MDIRKTDITDLLILTPRRFGDDRGFFSEVWNRRHLTDVGIDYNFVQDNQSRSAQVGTVRGLHFQSPPSAQAKLVRVGAGSIMDVAVDIRKGSPTYGQHVSIELSAENGQQLLVPTGFLHGFITREPGTEILYKCTNYYAPDCDHSVRFDDPDLSIDWGFDTTLAQLSAKDTNAIPFASLNSPFEYTG